MDITNLLNQVSEFHKIFKAPILEIPKIPSKDRCELRINILQEELNELKQSIEKCDIVEIADAIVDLQYVLLGTVLEFGLGEKFVELFNEVHKSNLSKACNSEQEALETILNYKKKGIEAYYKKIDDKFIVYRISDDKILKSINYSEAKLNKILEK